MRFQISTYFQLVKTVNWCLTNNIQYTGSYLNEFWYVTIENPEHQMMYILRWGDQNS